MRPARLAAPLAASALAPVLAATALVAAALGAIVLTMCSGTALAAPAQRVSSSGATLELQTVPPVPGVRVVLDGIVQTTGASGSLVIGTYAGEHTVVIKPPLAARRGALISFSRWLDGVALPRRTLALHQGINRIEAGFAFSYPIHVRFTNVAGAAVPRSAVKRLTMANSLGERFTFAPQSPPRDLAANRIVRDQFGLHALPIRYSVRDVVFSGAHVVYGGSQSFFVRPRQVWTVRLLLFPMHIEVRDALFGFPIGDSVRVRLVGGASRIVPLRSGHAITLYQMPRATYELVAKGPGLGLSSPATLTKPLRAKLLLLSWVDFGAVGAFVVLFIVGLPVLGGRIRRGKGGARMPVWHVGHHDQPPEATADGAIGAANMALPLAGRGLAEPADGPEQ